MRRTRFDDRINPAAAAAAASGDLANAVVALTPGGIEAQEAEGQRAFVGSQTLPKECPRAELEKLGFVFGNSLDDLFVEVAFPEGWTKTASGHSMWSKLLDPQGRERGGIFFKAAFYDRKAFMHLDRRYSYWDEYLDDTGQPTNAIPTQVRTVVKDGGKTLLFATGAAKYRDFAAVQLNQLKAAQWLNEHFPDWQEASAYWD